MTATSEVEQLRAALRSRLVIGQAQGLLMERLGIAPDQAMDYLIRTSNELNRKLVLVAGDLVRTRQLPTSGTADQESPVWQTASMLLPSVSRTNAVGAVADGHPDVHHAAVAQHAQDPVVDRCR